MKHKYYVITKISYPHDIPVAVCKTHKKAKAYLRKMNTMLCTKIDAGFITKVTKHTQKET